MFKTVFLPIVMILFILILVIFLTKKYKLSKKQIIIFFILVLFWTSVSIIRSYRKPFVITEVYNGGLGLEVALAAQIAAAYGLISFILRLPLFFLSDALNKKKLFIQIGMCIMAIASPSYQTLYLSSLSMGICASMLAIFNVIFSETFTKDNATVSVSILSSAPLLAEFIAAPIQYMGTYGEYKNFKLLWAISAILAIITLILTIFLKEIEVQKKELTLNKIKEVVSNKAFIYICFIALLQSFVKFSTSGTNMIVYNKSIHMSPLMLAYSDTVFATPQLIAGVLVGTYFIKKFRIERTLQLGIFCTILFFLTVLITNNPYINLIAYSLNGLGYGLIYNSLIAIALQYFDVSYRNISMGIFQAFFSAGIFFGDYIYKIILLLPKGIFKVNDNQNIFVITLFVSIIGIILCSINIYVNKNAKE